MFEGVLWTFVFHILNMVILFFILRWLLFKPVKKFLDEREQRFADREKRLESTKNEIDNLKSQYNKKIDDAKNDARSILEQANLSAEEHKKAIELDARKNAEKIVERSKKQVENERRLAFEELKTQTADLAVDIASKILEKNISKEDNNKIISEYLEKVK